MNIQQQIEHCHNTIRENLSHLTLYENAKYYFCIEFSIENYYSIYRKDGENKSPHEESFSNIKDGWEAWNNMDVDLEAYEDEMRTALAEAGVCTDCGDISGFNCICGIDNNQDDTDQYLSKLRN